MGKQDESHQYSKHIISHKIQIGKLITRQRTRHQHCILHQHSQCQRLQAQSRNTFILQFVPSKTNEQKSKRQTYDAQLIHPTTIPPIVHEAQPQYH